MISIIRANFAENPVLLSGLINRNLEQHISFFYWQIPRSIVITSDDRSRTAVQVWGDNRSSNHVGTRRQLLSLLILIMAFLHCGERVPAIRFFFYCRWRWHAEYDNIIPITRLTLAVRVTTISIWKPNLMCEIQRGVVLWSATIVS